MTEQIGAGTDGGAHPDLPTRLTMLIGGLMVALALSAITPVLSQIEHALAHNADEKLLIKMLVPFAGAAMVVGAPLTGFLIDRIGLRLILIVNSLIYALAGTAGFYLGNLHLLLGARLLVGCAAAGIATISMTLINTRLEGVTRAKWMGYHISTAMLGALIVFPAIGALGTLGWRWPFLIYGVGFLVTLLAVFGLQPVRQAPMPDQMRPAKEQFGNPLHWFPLRFVPLAIMVGSVTYLPTIYLSFVARDVGLRSPAVLSTIMLADSLIGAMMSLLFGWSQRRVSSHSAFAFSFFCTGSGMLIVALARGFNGIVAGMLIFGFGIGWFMPNLMTSLSQCVTKGQQGRSVGILKAAHYFASPLAVLAVEPISRRYGPSGAMMAGAVVSFCAVALFLSLSARQNQTARFAEAA